MEHGGLIVAESLQAQGVKHLYTLCGGHISPILSGCKQRGIKVWDCRHEASAVFAADATSRLSGIPGVAAVTAGPGVTNAITALQNAQQAQSPLILLGGASATVLRGRGSLQDIDQMSLVRPVVKAAWSVSRVRDITSVLDEAFAVAASGVPGPVFVELPLDVLYPEALVREWYGTKSGEQGGGIARKVVRSYLSHHTDQLFDPEPDHPMLGGLLQRGRRLLDASGSQVAQVNLQAMAALTARYLRQAQSPVILLGSQTVTQARLIPALVAGLERLGAPVFLSGMARGLLGPRHPLQYRHQRKQALRQADLIILAGVPCDFRLDYGNHLNRKATLVSANLSHHDLFKNRLPKVPVLGHPADFLLQLAEQFPPEADRFSAWHDTLTQADAARNSEIDAQALEQKGRINPIHLLQTLDAFLTDEAVLVADGGDFVATAAYTLRPRQPLSWLDPGVFGTLGVGGGFALGAAACRPDAEIWLIYGDGSSAYSLAEFDTFARHGRGVIALIGNDGCWNQIARDQVEVLHDDVGVMLRQSAYHAVAKGYGGEAFLLDDPQKIESTFKAARRLAQQGKPVLINAMLDKSDFRKGSLSV